LTRKTALTKHLIIWHFDVGNKYWYQICH